MLSAENQAIVDAYIAEVEQLRASNDRVLAEAKERFAQPIKVKIAYLHGQRKPWWVIIIGGDENYGCYHVWRDYKIVKFFFTPVALSEELTIIPAENNNYYFPFSRFHLSSGEGFYYSPLADRNEVVKFLKQLCDIPNRPPCPEDVSSREWRCLFVSSE